MIRMRHNDETPHEVNDINVTPFIDVVLVLLIIFMVAAPLSTVNIPVNLPASTEQPKPQPTMPVYLTIQANHDLALGDTIIQKDTLVSALADATKGNKEETIFLRADKTVDYGTLIQVMNQLRQAGYSKVGLVNAQGENNTP
ncbi:TonB system transport protein ExbD [Commensalibacter oyaizuii]|uniref:Biopolymer transport protein ExbD n=1 Tax=Commensalibacter oyaizuii TaxID=3043873 RepID=A0ABT6Q304_9PROT|nr:TonB system transport protein ExbD [Commensalibacter sp. TBRC 16381]MDI2091507.1 TonB system transport protein ExbD [Commensalibacter sp. TBRC 16381]